MSEQMRGKRVLIVDDAVFMRRVLGDILKGGGYEVCGEAASAEEGFRMYREKRPDLVTADIVMPGASGIEMVKRIIAEDPGARIVMVSALGQESFIREAMDLGARGFVVKPFRKEEALATLAKALEG